VWAGAMCRVSSQGWMVGSCIVQTRCALCSLESVCFSQDQIAVGHGSAAYIAVVWSLNGLVGALQAELEKAGYTAELHLALGRVMDWIRDPERHSKPAGDVAFVRNALVAHNTADDQRRRKAARLEAAAATGSSSSLG